MRSSRYAHKKGLTSLFIDRKEGCFVTCGNDSDVRVWRDLDDEEVTELTMEEPAHTIVCYDDKIYLGSSKSGMVKGYDRTSGKPDEGVVTRFTLPVTHMVITNDGQYLVVASSEIGVIRNCSLRTMKFQTFGYEHGAPILSLALDPRDEFLASASGDGSVRIWQYIEQECVHTLPGILMKINDIRHDRPLARLCWEPKEGRFLAIPVENGVQLYDREATWQLYKTLVKTSANEPQQQQSEWFSVCAFSHCGEYLAAGTLNGMICVWKASSGELVARKCVAKQPHICAIGWDPVVDNQLIYCDATGEIGVLKDLTLTYGTASVEKPPNDPAEEDVERRKLKRALTEFEDDGSRDAPEKSKAKKKPMVLDDEEEDSDIGALKRLYNSKIGLDEFGNTTENRPSSPMAVDEEASNLDSATGGYRPSTMAKDPAAWIPTSFAPSWSPTQAQAPFVVGSMPESEPDRCMKWNADGIIKQYNSEGDNSIDVQYHDASVHHQFNIDNSSTKFTLADINQDAVAFASQGTYQTEKTDRSQLRVFNLRAWDTAAKEWTVDMPTGENIRGLCLGMEWAAIVTDQRMVRVFSISSVQRYVWTLAGPVVTACGAGDRLAIVYHGGMGLDGDQCLSYVVYKIRVDYVRAKEIKKMTMMEGQVALSPKATLAWLGFVPNNGPLVTVDSDGIVRLLNHSFHRTWLQICDTKAAMKTKNETAFVVSVLEQPSRQIRCVPCKDTTSGYPTFRKGKPALTILDWSIPVCDTGADRGPLEAALIVNDIRKGFVDELFGDQEITKAETDAVAKLFAISLKTDRDCRSLEIARLMPSSEGMQTLIRQAVAAKRHLLAQKIGELALQRSEQMYSTASMDDSSSMGASNTPRRREPAAPSTNHQFDNDDDFFAEALAQVDEEKMKRDQRAAKLKRRQEQQREADQLLAESAAKGSLVGGRKVAGRGGAAAGGEMQRRGDGESGGANDAIAEQPKKPFVNPFKKTRPPSPHRNLPPGVSVFDDPSFAVGGKKRTNAEDAGNVDLPSMLDSAPKKDAKKKQATLDSFAPSAKSKRTEENRTESPSISDGKMEERPKKISGFSLFMQDREDQLIFSVPEGMDLLKHSMQSWKQLTPAERQAFMDRADELGALQQNGNHRQEATSVSID